jgi:polyphenol oxidase
MKQATDPSPIQSQPLAAATLSGRIAHGFFTREGGVSDGLYRGLNVGLGSQDIADNILENRSRVASWFGQPLEKLATVHQIHSPDIAIIDENYDGTRPQADALVTATPGIILGVLTADCGPILFADAENGVIGAAHAGWKGALTGVLENTIEAMIALGAGRQSIIAVLGPSISQTNYEVGPEFVARFLAEDESYSRFFMPSTREDHSMFDLPGLTVKRLQDAGVTAECENICTYGDENRFYSYRRTTHRGEPDYGRQISAIMLKT